MKTEILNEGEDITLVGVEPQVTLISYSRLNTVKKDIERIRLSFNKFVKMSQQEKQNFNFEEKMLELQEEMESVIQGQSPETISATAGRLCYSALDVSEILEKFEQNPEQSNKQISNLAKMGHVSTFEHVSFTFAIEGVDRALTHQLVRHRMASYSQKSQRYVDMTKNAYAKVVVPDEVKKDPEALELFVKSALRDFEEYSKLTEMLVLKYTEENPEADKRDIRGKALENARALLPNACETKIIVTMNARELIHFFNLRCCNRAQDGIRTVADQMLELVEDVCPNMFKNAGAPCINGKCPEGEKTCGHPKRKLLVKDGE